MKTIDLNIIDKIEKNSINGVVPIQAKFAQLSPSGAFIQKFYLIDSNGVLFYYGERGTWFCSEFNDNGVDNKKIKLQKFLEII